MKFETGSVFGNRYTLGDRIAIGGMGEVWRATDQVLGRKVAIKLLSPSLADQPGFTRRFREEARHTAQLGHPNIAAVHDYGEDSGASWLVMELVEGKPLSQIIKEEGTLPPRRVSAIMTQAALALQAAHEAGVIHRDVKPANILIRRDGSVKLTDFGIARAVDAAPITRTGEVMGTAQYISPEQAMGKPVGPASDLYALGVVTHEMLTGERPFDEGSPVATAMAHIHNPPPPLPAAVPQPLAGVVMACLAKDPSQRPHSGDEVVAALAGEPQSYAATEVIPPGVATTRRLGAAPQPTYPPADSYGPPTTPTASRPPEPARRRSFWIWLLPLLLVLGLVGYVLAQSGLLSSPSTPAPAQTSRPATTTPSRTTTTTTEPTPSSPVTTPTVLIDAAAFTGLTAAEAKAKLKAMGFPQVTILQADSPDIPQGQVMAIQPSGDVVPGTIVTLTISNGPASEQPTTSTSEPSSPSEPAPGSGRTNGNQN
ncbi:MAG: protein kinase, partial [Micrococcales bacterium]|nr:protein kinase [Micrococcales bacterium]